MEHGHKIKRTNWHGVFSNVQRINNKSVRIHNQKGMVTRTFLANYYKNTEKF